MLKIKDLIRIYKQAEDINVNYDVFEAGVENVNFHIEDVGYTITNCSLYSAGITIHSSIYVLILKLLLCRKLIKLEEAYEMEIIQKHTDQLINNLNKGEKDEK